jgi:hypothetical protein
LAFDRSLAGAYAEGLTVLLESGIKMLATESWRELCGKAAVEQEPNRLLELITEINRLLEQREIEKKPAGSKAQ